MPTLQPHLELTDTVTSIKFMDAAATTAVLIAAMPYRLSYGGWSPQVARRNKNPLGLPYVSVRETLTVDIFGTSAGDCYTKLQALNTLLDQGERWYNNEIVLPVFIRYQPLGSDKATYMRDVVIGGAADDSSATLMELPNDFNFTGFSRRLKGITISFWRRNGFWLGEEETQSLSNQSQRSVLTVTWTDNGPNLSPMELELDVNTVTTTPGTGMIITTHNDQYIGLRNGENIGGSSTVDTTNNAVGGNVGRFTCSTITVEAFYEFITEALLECEFIALYATIRNNSTTLDVYIQPAFVFGGNAGYVYLPEIKIPFVATPKPQVVFLGTVPTGGRQPFRISLFYHSLSGAPTFDIDQVVHVGVNRATSTIALGSTLISGGQELSIAHRLLAEPQLEISIPKFALGAFETRIGYTGSGYLWTGGTIITKEAALLVFMVQDTKWQWTTAGNVACTLSPLLRRNKAYLLPE